MTLTKRFSNSRVVQRSNSAFSALTSRDLHITRLVAQGCSDKDIAGRLSLTEDTVQKDVLSVMHKMEVTNRSHLRILYYEW